MNKYTYTKLDVNVTLIFGKQFNYNFKNLQTTYEIFGKYECFMSILTKFHA